MFHHAHSFIASKLYQDENPLLLVGSILPDIAVTKIIPWNSEGLHGSEANQKFKKFIAEKHPDFLDLANGINAHNILDDTSHLEYHGEPGYAFQNNEQLTKLVKKYYEIDEESARGKAHNYIESAVDIHLLTKNPECQTKLRLAISQVDREKLAEVLSEYFNTAQADFLNTLHQFFDLFTKYNFSQKEEWNSFWKDLEELLSLKNIEKEERLELIKKSLDITKHSYDDYLKYSIAEGKKAI